MNTIDINTQKGFASQEVSSVLQTDLFSGNLFMFGDIGSGRLVAVMSIIDQLIADGRSVLSIDCNSEINSFINPLGGINISSKGFSPDSYDFVEFNVTYNSTDTNKIREFLTSLHTSPTLRYQYIIIDNVELLFSSFTTEELAVWISKLNESQMYLISTSVSPYITKAVELYFENVLAFRSLLITETHTLDSGEAILKTSGVWQDHKVRFVPLAEEWLRFSLSGPNYRK